MGTEVLPPQSYFTDRMGLNPSVIAPRRKSHRRSSFIRPDPKKRVESSSSRSSSKTNGFVGKVTILKRGDSVQKTEQELAFCVNEMVPLRQIRVNTSNSCRSEEIYAGSACYSSPSPRKLPLPKFSKKNEGFSAVEDNATKDLRRLLRLD